MVRVLKNADVSACRQRLQSSDLPLYFWPLAPGWFSGVVLPLDAGDFMTSDTVLPGTPERGKPESFRGRTLSASLTVGDMKKSLAWYRDVVGFIVDEEYERGGKPVAVSLKAGAVKLMLNQDDGAKGERVKGEGFSVYITTAQNVDELANRIKTAGGTLESDPFDMPWGARVFRLKDPDGFRLVIASEPE
jgi:uncharacterized glyoxalase superfamily protein PhnB